MKSYRPSDESEFSHAHSHLPAAERRRQKIELAAYFRAAQRGFNPNHELDDWLDAEREIDNHVSDEASGADIP